MIDLISTHTNNKGINNVSVCLEDHCHVLAAMMVTPAVV